VTLSPRRRPRPLRRGLRLEYATLGWNVAGVVVLAITAISASSVALAAFGIDSLIEILASAVVVWQLRGVDAARPRAAGAPHHRRRVRAPRPLHRRGGRHHAGRRAPPGRSVAGAVWLGATAAVMFLLASGKAVTGRQLGNRVLRTEARITLVDGALAVAVLTGVVLNAAVGWWWADPVSALALVAYGLRESRHAWTEAQPASEPVSA
jgi:divalent metal cation (Fe/Co/Zn/Cd) transporter